AALPRGADAPAAAPYDLVITNARVVDGAGNPWFRADVAVKGGRIARVGRVAPDEARRVLDGSGNPWFRADVAVRGGRIARVGRVAAAEGARAVDAGGRIVAPGFIDAHAHVENIYAHASAENFVRMGVTSLVTGNCGASAVSVGEFLGRISETPLAVNLATLVGHNSVRREVFGEQDRAPTPEELGRMKALVARAMQEGALGLSTGLIYVPGVYARTDEVLELARVAAGHGGLYATHMRDEGLGVAEAIRESIEIGERAGLPVEISHFKLSAKRLWGRSEMALGLVREARRRGLPVTVDQYAYAASSTSLDSRLPEWVLEGGREEGKKRLADPERRARAAKEMREELRRGGFKDFSHATVASYQPRPEYNGKSVAEVTRLARGKSDVASQIAQVLEMYEAGGAAMVYHSMGEQDVRRIMREPFTMFGSDSGVREFGEGVPHPRGYGNNARVLGLYVRDLGLLTLEDAVRKMTSLPAQTFGLRDRGLVREGMAADLVVFDERAVADRATFERPHQYASGFDYVFVNGDAVVEAGRLTGARPGQALRGTGAQAARAAP
ncbi:MAG TPA: D-aminoacylase, partial [Pyrinomonadaceae bacterium]|nr:D-aminoacylase [Pyrinomonadaceae bacterium]